MRFSSRGRLFEDTRYLSEALLFLACTAGAVVQACVALGNKNYRARSSSRVPPQTAFLNTARLVFHLPCTCTPGSRLLPWWFPLVTVCACFSCCEILRNVAIFSCFSCLLSPLLRICRKPKKNINYMYSSTWRLCCSCTCVCPGVSISPISRQY